MTWVKLDDGFVRHPRMVAAGLHGRALFIAGLCYCGAHLTDGFIPKGAVPMLVAEAGCQKSAAAKLVEVGSWLDHGDRYEVHDFLLYNPSREKVLSDREASTERQRRFRGRSNAVTNGGRHAVSSASPTRPDPVGVVGSVGSSNRVNGCAPDCATCENTGWVDSQTVEGVVTCPDCERVKL